jgi:hypothetical protein
VRRAILPKFAWAGKVKAGKSPLICTKISLILVFFIGLLLLDHTKWKMGRSKKFLPDIGIALLHLKIPTSILSAPAAELFP